MSTISPYKVNSYRRICDVCGRPRQIENIRFADGVAICSFHPQYRTAQQLNKINARLKAPRLLPVPQPKALAPIDTFLAAESQLFKFIVATAPYDTVDATVSVGGPATDVFFDGLLTSCYAAGEAARYLYGVITENRRPARWIEVAKTKLRSLADAMMRIQNGFGLELGLAHMDLMYGSFETVYSNGTTIYTCEENALAGLSVLYAYRILGDEKYLQSAKAAASFLRFLQMGGEITDRSVPSTLDAAGNSRHHFGWFTHLSAVNGDDEIEFDHIYYPSDIVALEFLTELLATTGDFMCGSTGTSSVVWFATVTTPPAALLSAIIVEARAFWTDGAYDQATGLTFSGLSSARPHERFNAYPTAKGDSFVGITAGTGSWENADAAIGTTINGLNWSKGLRSLHAIEGLSSQVTDCYDYLASFDSNPAYELPDETNQRYVYRGQAGEYDPAIAPATVLKVRASASLTAAAVQFNGSSFYDWAAAGNLSAIAAQRSRAGFKVSRETLSVPRQRSAEDGSGRDNDTLYLGTMGLSGLSFQPWSSATGRLQSVARAAQVGLMYRQTPVARTGQGH